VKYVRYILKHPLAILLLAMIAVLLIFTLKHPLVTWLLTLLIAFLIFAAAVFDALFIGLILVRGTTKYLVEDLGLARHILVTWLIVPFFWVYILFLIIIGKLEITVNSPIPWSEERLIFVGNHAMAKLQDTFLMPIIIFLISLIDQFRSLVRFPWSEEQLAFMDKRAMAKLKDIILIVIIIFFGGKLRNPIRHFPFSMADDINFFQSKFFQWFIGTFSLIRIDRTVDWTMKSKKVLEECEKRWMEYSAMSLIGNIEGGRTENANNWITSAGGSKLGAPTRGIALLARKTNTLAVPYWGRIINVPYREFSGQALVWKLCGWIFRREWRKMGFYDARPKACPKIVLWGLIEIGLNPGIKVYIDINHPEGLVRPRIGQENSRQLTQRYVSALLSLGDHQLERIEGSRKK